MDPNKKKLRQEFKRTELIERCRLEINKFWKSIPSSEQVYGINVIENILPSSDAKQLMNLFGCYEMNLIDFKKRFEVAFDKEVFITNLLEEIQNIGFLTPEEQLSYALAVDGEILNTYDLEAVKNILLITVMDDIRNGYNCSVEDYAHFLLIGFDDKEEYNFNLKLLYEIGQGAAYVAIEAHLRNELKRLERIREEELEDKKIMEETNHKILTKTPQMITVLDALGVIDFLKKQAYKEFQTGPDYSMIAEMISSFTNFKSANIRPILRELNNGSKNDPYNVDKNKKLFAEIKKKFEL